MESAVFLKTELLQHKTITTVNEDRVMKLAEQLELDEKYEEAYAEYKKEGVKKAAPVKKAPAKKATKRK